MSAASASRASRAPGVLSRSRESSSRPGVAGGAHGLAVRSLFHVPPGWAGFAQGPLSSRAKYTAPAKPTDVCARPPCKDGLIYLNGSGPTGAAARMIGLTAPPLRRCQPDHAGISIEFQSAYHDGSFLRPPERSVIAGGVGVSAMLAQRVLLTASLLFHFPMRSVLQIDYLLPVHQDSRPQRDRYLQVLPDRCTRWNWTVMDAASKNRNTSTGPSGGRVEAHVARRRVRQPCGCPGDPPCLTLDDHKHL